MIRRVLQERAERAAGQFPVVTITGPRQAGKTTLCRMAFGEKPYANLELPDVRAFALSDPRGFLASFPEGAVLDEVQRAPDLLSYIQGRVDDSGSTGEFILTGSHHFGLLRTVSQSLAGRTAVLNLLPLSHDETRRFPNPREDLLEVILAGGYPRIHDKGIPPREWLAGYVTTYLERDVREVLQVGDLTAFQSFLQVAAGHVGRLLNLSALASDLGITHNTAKAWLSVLEAGFIAFRLSPFHRNLKKRLTKRPKLYFHDTGLVCYLLGISTPDQLRVHPLRGPIFECWAVSEVLKSRVHRGIAGGLFFYRDHKGQEVDLLVEAGARLLAVEMKAGQTVPADAFGSLRAFEGLASRAPSLGLSVESILVYGGEERQTRTQGTVLPWFDVASTDWGVGDRPN